MALAVINSDGTDWCIAGSEDETHYAVTAPLITLENQVASTILDVHPFPDHSDCAIWALITLGSQTDCIPAVIPPWSSGVSGVLWDMIPANHNIDTAQCALGGEIIVMEPGTEILIE